MSDKVGRFESHAQFLRKCLENKIVAKGLQVYVEPSIGNRDDEFLNKWHSRLEEFGRLLTTDVIEFSEKTIGVTKEETKNTAIALKSQTDANQHKTLKATISDNQTIRNNDLKHRKDKKFYALKYKREPREPQAGTIQLQTKPFQANAAGNVSNNCMRYSDAVRTKKGDSNLSPRPSRTDISHKHLHERISIPRKPFRTRIHSPTTEQTTVIDRHNKIGSLQRQINELRRESNTMSSRPVEHDSAYDNSSTSKNEYSAQSTRKGLSAEINEMKTLFGTVMQTLQDFDKKLTVQSSTNTIHLERL